MKNMNYKKACLRRQGIAPIIWILIIALLGGVIIVQQVQKKPNGQVACTEEAKVCPDGSVVVRVGPSCEFAKCPQEQEDETIKPVSVKTCLPNDTPSITVLSPNGGEIFQAGGQITVEWDSCNVIPPISIILIKHDSSVPYTQSEGGGDYGGFSLGSFDPFIGTQDDGSEQLILPTSSDPNLISGQHYFISISGQDDPTIGSGFHPRDYSDSLFTIN